MKSPLEHAALYHVISPVGWKHELTVQGERAPLGIMGGQCLSEEWQSSGHSMLSRAPQRDRETHTSHFGLLVQGSTHFFCNRPDVLALVAHRSVTYSFYFLMMTTVSLLNIHHLFFF